jgi:hypothetical protein
MSMWWPARLRGGPDELRRERQRQGGVSLVAVRMLPLGVLVAVLVGCSAGNSSGSGGTGTAQGLSSWALPPPAGPDGPSASAQQVCSPDDGQKEIAAALGVSPVRVEAPTWQDHLYACHYDYPDGSFILSVKELPGDAQTIAHMEQLAAKLGKRAPLDGIGQSAFYTTNGSIVARKDFKVLLVDVSGLPPRFGNPPAPPAANSRTIATVIMGCWSGA